MLTGNCKFVVTFDLSVFDFFLFLATGYLSCVLSVFWIDLLGFDFLKRRILKLFLSWMDILHFFSDESWQIFLFPCLVQNTILQVQFFADLIIISFFFWYSCVINGSYFLSYLFVHIIFWVFSIVSFLSLSNFKTSTIFRNE